MTHFTLAGLGWSAHFQRQIGDTQGKPARVFSVARDRLETQTPDGPVTLTVPGEHSTGTFAVGDWVLFDPSTLRVTLRLERQTLLQRRAAGTSARGQLIAANVDTLGIVTSCNADFNVARIERYLSLAASAGCLPLVVLTKADQTDDPDDYRRRAEMLSPLVAAVAVNAHDPMDIERLVPWCGTGQTLALVGSSGVGKTTLTNGLTGRQDATRAIREDDAKGRHTTTARSMWSTRAGGWLIDTPGMRALRLTEASEGIDTVFSDLTELALQCRFSDCTHRTEPGCAIRQAVEAGDIDTDRVARWEKLQREDARNSETLAESRARDRALNRLYREGQAEGRRKRGD